MNRAFTKRPFFPVVLLIAGLTACGSDKPADSSTDKKAESAIELAAVDVYHVSQQTLSGKLPVSGVIQPVVQTTVKSRVAAEVESVAVREGMQVEKGQSLAQLGLQDIAARLKQAEAALSAAKVEATLSRALADRNRKLYEKKFFSEIEYQKSVGEATAREENVRAQQALVDIAKKASADANVRAPIAGIIAQRYIEPGSSVGIEARLFDIVDLSKMELAVPVPASEIAAVKPGQAVVFTVSGFGDKEFKGTVVRVNPVADSGTRAITVYIQVNNADMILKGGMYAQGGIAVGASGQGLTIPLEALHEGKAGAPTWALVLRNNKLEKQALGLEGRDDRLDRVVVTSGLKEGDVVVVARLTENAAGKPARLDAAQ